MTPPDDNSLAVACPLLWELMTLSKYSDGTKRILPTIRVDRRAGGYLVVLQDHASRQQCSVLVSQFAAIPHAIESLVSHSLDCWRPYDSPLNKGKSQGKKTGQ